MQHSIVERVGSEDGKLLSLRMLDRYQILGTAPEAAFDNLADLAATVCNAPIALISFLGTQRGSFKAVRGISVSEIPQGSTFSQDTSRAKTIHVVNDTWENPGCSGDPWVTSNLKIRFYAGVPLVTPNGEAIGVIAVLDRVPRVLNEQQLSALQALSQQVMHQLELRRQLLQLTRCPIIEAKMLKGCQIEEAFQQQVLKERIILTTTRRIHESLQLEAILNATVAEVQQFLQVDRVLVYRLDADGGGCIVSESVRPEWPATIGTVIHDCYFADLYVQQYRQGRVQAVEDIHRAGLSPCHVELLEGLQVQANLAVPIVNEEKLWGLLIAQHCVAPRPWQALEIDLLKQLAEQAAIAIQKSELYQQAQVEISQRQQAEVALKQQVARERLVGEIAQRIRHSLNLQETLNTTVNEVRQFLEADRVLLYQVHADGTGRVITESVKFGYLALLNQSLPIEMFPQEYHQVYCQGRVRRVVDVETDPMSPCLADALRQIGVRSKLVVPILQAEALWGLLIAHQCSRPRQWQEVETELLKQLATQIGMSIQQSELFEQVQTLTTVLEAQVQERTAQLQQALDLEAALKRITDKVRDSLDENQILQTAVEELAQLLKVDRCFTALYNLKTETSTIYYEVNHLSASATGEVVQMADSLEIYSQLLQGHCLNFCQTTPTTNALHQKITVLACSMLNDQEVLGDLWLFHQSPRHFNDLEIRLVRQVANQCAIALRQAYLYKAAQMQVQELEKLNRLKDEFLSTVSHELRTPMSSIKMATQMLEISLGKLGICDSEHNPVDRYVKILQAECQRETSLINDLLDLARLEADMEPLTHTEIHLQTWIPQVANVFAERIENQHQQLQLELDSDLPPMMTDQACLERILTEVLNNACKYTPATGTITISAQQVSDQWQLSVSNTGVTISAEHLVHLFDKFYRIPKNDPWKHGGTGLGLALVKKLVEHLGGRISAQSFTDFFMLKIQLPIIEA